MLEIQESQQRRAAHIVDITPGGDWAGKLSQVGPSDQDNNKTKDYHRYGRENNMDQAIKKYRREGGVGRQPIDWNPVNGQIPQQLQAGYNQSRREKDFKN